MSNFLELKWSVPLTRDGFGVWKISILIKGVIKKTVARSELKFWNVIYFPHFNMFSYPPENFYSYGDVTLTNEGLQKFRHFQGTYSTAISIMSHLQDLCFYDLILRRYLAEIFPIRRKTLYNQSIMTSSEGPVTFAPVAERLAAELSLPVFTTGLSLPWFELWSLVCFTNTLPLCSRPGSRI